MQETTPSTRRCLHSAITICLVLAGSTQLLCQRAAMAGASETVWHALFDGHSMAGWRAAEHPETWRVEDGCLVGSGARSHLFYTGAIAHHDFKNFELRAEALTSPGCNSGIFFHTEYQETGWPSAGYEVQINNSHHGVGNWIELKRTGSLYGVRNIYESWVPDGEWFTLRVRVAGKRVRVWVQDRLLVDYIEPKDGYRKPERKGRVLARGTMALQGHDPDSRVKFRRIEIRTLPDDLQDELAARPSVAGYGLDDNTVDRAAGHYIPVIDFHVHLRGGMTLDKALTRQAITGINVGVLRNLGLGWPLETDDQLRAFLDRVKGQPAFVGVQVNDRGWHKKHDPALWHRLDYVLGDTMIMPMPDNDSAPVKLWMPDLYSIKDAQKWMERYMRHNLRVLAEPITILANPTYLPPPVEDRYDELWTDQRMQTIIRAAIANHVALEINARSGLPHDRFIRMAKEMGAKFSFGSNNFDDQPIDMSRYFEAIDRYGLTKEDMYVPARK